MPISQRLELARELTSHSEDADDPNLPLMVWYGLIPTAESDPDGLALFASTCRWPTTRRLVARRLALEIDTHGASVGKMLTAAINSSSPALLSDILTGLSEGLRGRRKVSKPPAWDLVVAHVGSTSEAPTQALVRDLGALFGDGRALDEVRTIALDDRADLAARRAALDSLIEARPADLRQVCQKLVGVRFLNTTAVRGLSLFEDPAIATSLVASYRTFHPSERSAVVQVLASRKSFVPALLDALAAGKIPRQDLSAFQARQIRELGAEELTHRLAEVWGESRDSTVSKAEEIAAWKKRLTPDILAQADPSHGRQLFRQACASCHKLYGEGGTAGPDLTGAGRDNLDYLLENLVDPSATVSADFRMTTLALDDGRILNGIVRARTANSLSLQTPEEVLTLDRASIEAERASDQSLMPEGLLAPLGEKAAQDLIAYLLSRVQVPLPSSTPTEKP
jgi:putative heme-binding domain-containing protein